MRCPYCNHAQTKVTDKRDIHDKVRRRRECARCGKRFTTYEEMFKNDFYVIKKDGRHEKFSRDKLANGVQKAFEKRPISEDIIVKMIDNIENELRKKGKEVKTTVIGELVMKKLVIIDKIADVRFASVYREFQDVKDFKKILTR